MIGMLLLLSACGPSATNAGTSLGSWDRSSSALPGMAVATERTAETKYEERITTPDGLLFKVAYTTVEIDDPQAPGRRAKIPVHIELTVDENAGGWTMDPWLPLSRFPAPLLDGPYDDKVVQIGVTGTRKSGCKFQQASHFIVVHGAGGAALDDGKTIKLSQ